MNERVKYLLSIPQSVQLSPEWFATRKDKLTASMIAGVLLKTPEMVAPFLAQFPTAEDATPDPEASCSPYETFLSSMQRKAGLSSFTGNSATLWGQKYESPICTWYASHRQVAVHEVGLLNHADVCGRDDDDPGIPFISASPDGITDEPEPVLIEIKCPSSRQIKPSPPFYYWIQMQIQLAVCNFDLCDFVEASIVEYPSYEALLTYGNIANPHGVLIEYNTAPYALETKTFCYAPQGLKPAEIAAWIEENTRDETRIALPVFWNAKTIRINRITRDKKWFASIIPRLTYVHERLLWYQTAAGKMELQQATKLAASLGG